MIHNSIRATAYNTGRHGCYSSRYAFPGRRAGYGHGARRWYNRWTYPSRSSIVVYPPTFRADRYVEPIYVTGGVVEQHYVPEPVFQAAPAAQPFDVSGVTLLPPVEPPSPEQLTSPLRAGDAAFRAGDYAEARRHYVRAQLDGVYAGEAALAYALVHFAEGDHQLAALALRRGLAQLPDAIHQPIDLVWLYGRPEVLQRQVHRLTTHLAEYPADAPGWFVLGYVRFSAGDPVGAAQALDQAIALNPGDPLPHLVREAAISVSGSWPPEADLGAAVEPTSQGASLYPLAPDWPD